MQCEPEEIEAAFAGMRRAGRLAAATLDFIAGQIVPDIATLELDRQCEAFIRDQGGVPAVKGYHGYPKATCVSVNEVACHGVPGGRRLAEGDIVNIDLTVALDGWHGDTSRMYLCGVVDEAAQRLVAVTREATMLAIAGVRPGRVLSAIGRTIEGHAQANGYTVVRQFCGHGIGRVFHESPAVRHFDSPITGLVLRPGLIFTVEPILNAGGPELTVLDDGWTAVTTDGALSAQFEHTVGVTPEGCEIFTLPAPTSTPTPTPTL